MKLIKNRTLQAGGLYMIGNLFNKAISLLMIPVLTRMMSVGDYGILNTYLSWVSIFTVFVGMSLGSSFRSAYSDYKNDFPRYTSALYGLSVISGLLTSVVIILIFQSGIFDMTMPMLICCLIHSYMGFVSDSMCIKYMMECKYIKRTLLLAVPNLLVAILSIIFIYSMEADQYWGRIIAYVLIYSVIGIVLLFHVAKAGKCFYQKEYWNYAAKYSLPLIFHSLSVVVLSSSDRIMISSMRSSEEAGIYSLIYNISMAVKVVTSALEGIWIPWFTQRIAAGQKDDINKKVPVYIGSVSVLVCLIMAIAPEVIKIIAPRSYWSGINLTVPIVVASYVTFLYSISVDLEYYHKTTSYIAFNTIVAAVVNLALNFVFIPKYGTMAAAYTTVTAYSVSFILHYIHARRLDRELFPFKVYAPYIILVIGMSLFVSLSLEWVAVRWIIGIVITGLYALIIFRKK